MAKKKQIIEEEIIEDIVPPIIVMKCQQPLLTMPSALLQTVRFPTFAMA